MHRVLIVEDSPTMQSLLVSSLEDFEIPLKITQASSGFEALRHLPRASYDLILTDINMPDINGLELVSFVKSNQSYREIPLVIISTESSERDRAKGLELVAFVKQNEAYRSIPLVIVSTEGSERDRDKGLSLGADAYLVKPFDPEALRQIARDLLASRRGQ